MADFEIIAEGTPEDICKAKTSYTGEYLKPMLEKSSNYREAAE